MSGHLIERSPWLEAHDEFEGVGAHELNPRYAHVDGGDWDQDLADLVQAPPVGQLPALFEARRLLSLAAVPIRLDGPDVSHHNYDAGPLNWNEVAAAPCTFGATKLTQSVSYLDPTSSHSRLEMRRVALRHRGLYHWLSSTTDPAQQAWWYLANLGQLQPGEYTMLDAEEAGINVDKCDEWYTCIEQGRKSVNGRNSIEGTKRPGVGYTGAYVTGGTIWQSTRMRESPYGLRPFILAAYTTEVRAKSLPGVAAYPWQAWQFSSNGPVPGVTGRCDMNRRDDDQAFDLAAGVMIQPTPGDDMSAIRLLIPTDDPKGAQFFAECFGGPDATGQPSVALSCRWTGDGGDPKVQAAVAAHKGAGMTNYEIRVADFLNIALDGPLPPGWTAEQFRNTGEIRARNTTPSNEDTVARDGVEALKVSVASLGSELGDTRSSLRRAGGA